MKVLNLERPSMSDIEFELSKFPDGQQNVTILSQKGMGTGEEHCIFKSIRNWRDLEQVVCAVTSLKGHGYPFVSLYTPYLVGGRSDRQFIAGGNNYMKHIIGPILNSLGLCKVYVHTPHSDVTEAVLQNFHKINQNTLFNFALESIPHERDRIILVAPDAGAEKRVLEIARQFNIPNVITCSKEREIKTGKIIRTIVPDHDPKDAYIILDDLCDGGRTFLEVSHALREMTSIIPSDEPHYLVVTHGIFSAGYHLLEEAFTKVFHTNSYREALASQKFHCLDLFKYKKEL